MAKKKKNSNYITEKTIAKKQQAIKAKKNAKIKRYALLITATVLITACIITGLVLIVMGINKYYDKKYFEAYQDAKEHIYDDISTSIDKQAKDHEVTHKVSLTIKNYGKIELELYGKEAPNTVANFIKLVENGHYNGTNFANVVTSSGQNAHLLASGNTATTLGEIASEKKDNDVTHIRGTISMTPSSTSGKCSANKFFIALSKQTSYDTGSHTPFGMVTSGMDVVDKIVADLTFPWVEEYGDKKPTVTIEKAEVTESLIELADPVVTHTARIEIDGYDAIELELYGHLAPRTVDQFVKLVNQGYYNGKKFTQAVKDGMLLGGATSTLDDKINTVKGEFLANGISNTLSHKRGVISLYRASQSVGYDSGSYRFFIVQQTNSTNTIKFDGYYASFGQVIGNGMDVIDKLYKDLEDGKYISTNGSISEDHQPTIKSITITSVLDDSFVVEPTHKAEIEIEGYGKLNLDLYGNNAPITVEHFIKLVNQGFYNGKTFHRADVDFMIQGGDPNKNGSGNYTEGGEKVTIKGEFLENGIYNAVKHERGTISMARATDMDSASCQFFIVHKTSSSNTTSLDYKYAAFGKLDEDSMKIIDQIFADLVANGEISSAEKETVDDSISTAKQPVIKSIKIVEVLGSSK